MREIVPFKQERKTRGFCECVDEAISVVQACFMLTALAVECKSVDGDARMAWGHVFHFDSRFLNESVKLGDGFRPVPIHHHYSDLDQRCRGNQGSIRVGEGFSVFCGILLSLKDCEQRGC